MTKLMGVVGVVVGGLAGCAEELPPSCQQAMTHFYGAGCYFADLSTTPPTQYSLNAVIVDCKQTLIAVPDRCQPEFDDYMICLNSIPPMSGDAVCGSCSPEQDALFGCD